MAKKEQNSRHLIYQSAFGGKKLFVDKVNEKIILENCYLFFIRRKRVIPFADISIVVVNREVYSGGPYVASEVKWKLSIVVGGAKVAIEDSKNEWEMWSLGQRISQLTRKVMVDRSSGKGETRFNPNISREEIVERWKKRAEQEAAERKKQGHQNC